MRYRGERYYLLFWGSQYNNNAYLFWDRKAWRRSLEKGNPPHNSRMMWREMHLEIRYIDGWEIQIIRATSC